MSPVTSDYWGYNYGGMPVGHEGVIFFQRNFTATIRWVISTSLNTFRGQTRHLKFRQILRWTPNSGNSSRWWRLGGRGWSRWLVWSIIVATLWLCTKYYTWQKSEWPMAPMVCWSRRECKHGRMITQYLILMCENGTIYLSMDLSLGSSAGDSSSYHFIKPI